MGQIDTNHNRRLTTLIVNVVSCYIGIVWSKSLFWRQNHEISGVHHTWRCPQRPRTSSSLGTWLRICHTTLVHVERRASNCAEALWERDWDKNKALLWNAEEKLKPFCTETTSVFLTGARSESWGVRWTSRWRGIARCYRLQPAKMTETHRIGMLERLKPSAAVTAQNVPAC